jgi:hypothetical protein
VFPEVVTRRSRRVVSEAMAPGVAMGELPAAAVTFFPPLARQYRPTGAIGLTYTTPGRVTMTAQYDDDEAGLTHSQWCDFVARARGAPPLALRSAGFRYARSLVQQRQELISRGQISTRIVRNHAFGIDRLALASSIDRFMMAQGAIDFQPSDVWSDDGLAQASIRRGDPIFGNSPQRFWFQPYVTRCF